jgi:proteasome lid subunit RPN8/RPN11
MSRLVLTAELLTQLRTELLESPLETCAILYGRAVLKKRGLVRIVVREFQRVTEADYQEHTEVSAQLRPEFVAAVTQRARKNGESLVFVHSHPFPLNEYSATDDVGEKKLRDFLADRTPGIIHATLLVTPETTIARVLGGKETIEVVGVGPQLLWGAEIEGGETNQAFDRQVRVFGEASQRRLRAMRVGIVGLGGTGSIVLEQLAHLGIGRFLLIDPDVVERTNLNRLVGATEIDISKPKVETAAAFAKRINPKVQVEAICGSVLLASVAEQLADVDFLFCCTDSHGSRAVLNQFAYQYLVPSIDMGVAIVSKNKKITDVVARSQMLAPGLGCLMCGDLLNPEAVRVDLLTDFERAADPYIVGIHEPAPAVISLNATIASMSVTMFLSAVIGIPSRPRLINYNGITGISRSAEINCHPTCIACSLRGALARANEHVLPARLS